MATIFIAGHLLRGFASPSLPNWYGHLFLIKSSDWVPDDPSDLIVRGGPQFEIPSVGGAIELQNNISYGSSADYPTSRGWEDVENPSQYWGYERINSILEAEVDFVWNTLVDLASQIAAFRIDYDLLNQNSNSTIATLLWAIGIKNIPEIEIGAPASGVHYDYPASGHLLSHDWLLARNYSYVIRGNDVINDAPINDRLFAIDSLSITDDKGDYVVGFAGDDQLFDGNRADTLNSWRQ